MECVWADPRFWVSVASAAITLGAVIVALFLRELRARFRPPILQMDLARENGQTVTVTLAQKEQAIPVSTRHEKSRWYHLRISNPRRKADSVNGVSVTMLRVERKSGGDEFHETWSGDIPLYWRNEMPDTERRVIGTWAEADLCNVVKDKWLALCTKVTPNDLQAIYRVEEDTPVDLVLTVQARGNEVDSDVQRWRVFWDGQWEDGEKEMRKHLSVTRMRA